MFIYDLAIWFYKLGICIASLFSRKLRGMRRGEQSAVAQIRRVRCENDRWIWLHAASLGEFEQGRPIIERIRAGHPEYKILLTFFSPSGYDIRHNYAGADLVTYLPLDTPRAARRFLDALRPEIIYIIKYEFWLNYLRGIRRRGIRAYLVSAIFRTEQPFFRWYGGIFRSGLRAFHTLYVQDPKSQELLHSIGVDNVAVVGDTRFDRVADIARQAKTLPAVRDFAQGHHVIVAGSTWPPDEQLLAPYINRRADTGTRMIIAPHHVEPARIRELTERLTCRYQLYSQLKNGQSIDADVLIIDTIGLLSSLYQYGRVAYIGGGFGAGIHNTLEAAVWAVPVVFGPRYAKFREARDLIQCGGATSISTAEACTEALDNYLTNNKEHAQAAGQYVQSHTGASDIIYQQTI